MRKNRIKEAPARPARTPAPAAAPQPAPAKAPAATPAGTPPRPHWTFLSNHAHVLICLAQDPHMRLRDVADRVGITERAVHNIVQDLQDANILTRHREGRRNHYQIHPNHPLRHPLESHRQIADLLRAVLG